MKNTNSYLIRCLNDIFEFLSINIYLFFRHQQYNYSIKTHHRLFPILIISIFCMDCGSKAAVECKQLCGLSEEQQYTVFKSYPPEKQFNLYVSCNNEKTCSRDSESPHDYYGQWMAKDTKALPFLIKKLQSEEDERTQRDIIYVLRFMALNGYLKGEYDVPKVVNESVVKMRGKHIDYFFNSDRYIKQSEKWAKEIEASIN